MHYHSFGKCECVVPVLGPWMSKLPDSMHLHNISMPGTHNSCAINASVAVENQQWTLRQQLDAGIRFLDIRVGEDLQLYHGIVALEFHWTDVMDQVTRFLNKYPSETIVMRVKYENGNGSVASWKPWFAKNKRYIGYFYNNVRQAFPISLQSVRKKIVVLDDIGANFPYVGLSYNHSFLRIVDEYRVWLIPCICSGLSIDEKVRLVIESLSKAHTQNNWNIIFTSGAVGMAPPHVASETNAQVLRFLTQNPQRHVGTIVMDFPSIELIKSIIGSS